MIPSPWPALVLALGVYRIVTLASATVTFPIVDGTCECGCGQATRLAPHTDRSKGWVEGEPLRFVLGHNARVTNRPRRTSVGPEDWDVEGLGFTTPCWIWKHGRPHRSGHHRVGIDGHFEAAHVAVYTRIVGPVPDGHELHHLCQQPACVNPAHLRPLTKSAHISVHKRKLSAEAVRAIRADRRPLREIADDYSISSNYASNVRSGIVRQDVAA